MIKKTILTSLALMLSSLSANGASTADYYKCSYKEGGEWNYGRVPNVCAASPFGPDSTVYADYPELIFMDPASRSAERTRYVTELSAAIRDAAEYYIKKRKPSVSAEELAQWKFAIQLVGAHESQLSHYRKTTDTRLKMMRGDYGHGHGVMQIDDRSHFNPINSGIAWNLITNLTYAMDIYYTQWERAPKQSCVSSATNWKSRIRAAWAAYNGGPGSICRWTNSSSAWAANDKNFLDMYTNQTWKTYLSSSTMASSIDVACLIEKRENCLTPGNDQEFIANKLYKIPDNSTCAYVSGKLACVTESRDAICLRAISSSIDVSSSTAVPSTLGKTVTKYDRHALCEKYDATLIPVGGYLKNGIAINMRSTPGGTLLATVPAGQVLEITDFEVRNVGVNDRYYQVTYSGKKGYIYAGDKSDYSSWVVETTALPTLPTTLARVGESVSIVAGSGINLRATPGGTYQLKIPSKSTLKVVEYFITGSDNDVYYKVKYGSSTGYIFSGSLLPKNTMSLWTKRVQ